MRGSATLALLALGATPCFAAVEAVNVYDPRRFGYFIGDTLERRVEIITNGGTELFTAALPRPGPVTYWLDLIAIDDKAREEQGRQIHDITLKYQNFYSALEATNLDIPAFPLKFKNPHSVAPDGSAPADASASGNYVASVPALKLVVSPLRNIVLDDLMPEKTGEISDVMRPDAIPQEIWTVPKERLLAMSLIALAASGGLLLWHYAIWPFSRRRNRPFTQADRQIRAIGGSNAPYREALLVLHRALDEAAGRRVFSGDVSTFIAKHRNFTNLAPRLRDFFENSRLYFFSDDRAAAEQRFPIENVRMLVADLAREERAA